MVLVIICICVRVETATGSSFSALIVDMKGVFLSCAIGDDISYMVVFI